MEKWLPYKIFNNQIIAGSSLKISSFYANFSLATHTGDNVDKILKNRDEFIKEFNENLKFVNVKQIHSDKIINIDEYNLLNGWIELPIEADGMVTTKKGVILSILTADCLAIIAVDEKKGIIGAVHAGWRGTKKQIASKLIKKMKSLGSNPKDIKCAISPGICGNCYEVGYDVIKNFKDYPTAIKPKDNGKWLFDNKEANVIQLLNSGILKDNIEISNYCTYCNNDKFFSYRKGDTKGRFVTFVGII